MFADYESRVHPTGVSLDGIRDPAYHAARRRPWARAMNTSATKHYEDILRQNIATIVGAFQSRLGQKLDISAWMTFYGCVSVYTG